MVQRLAGHSSPATTATYDRRRESATRQAAQKLIFPAGDPKWETWSLQLTQSWYAAKRSCNRWGRFQPFPFKLREPRRSRKSSHRHCHRRLNVSAACPYWRAIDEGSLTTAFDNCRYSYTGSGQLSSLVGRDRHRAPDCGPPIVRFTWGNSDRASDGILRGV